MMAIGFASVTARADGPAGDPIELARTARALGAAGIAKAIHDGPDDRRAAALRALPHIEESVLLIDDVVAQLDADAMVASAAAAALLAITPRLTPEGVERWEIPADTLSRAAVAAENAAADRSRPASMRLDCLRALPALYQRSGRSPDALLLRLADDAAAELRIAATDLADALPTAAGDDVLFRLAGDAVAAVAAQAARLLCERAPDLGPLLVPLHDRIRVLSKDASLPRPLRAALRRCAPL